MLEGFLHLFARRSVVQVLIDIADILLVTYVVYRALLVLRGTRAMQMGIGLGVILLVVRAGEVGGAHHPLQPAQRAALVDHPHRGRRLPERHPPRAACASGARAFFGGLARQQESKVIDEVVAAATELARHRMGALIALRAGREPRRVRGGPGDGHRRRGAARAAREPLRAREPEQAARRRGRHPEPAHRQGGRLLPDARHEGPRQVARLAPPRGARHHRGDRRRRRRRVSEERGTISFCFNGNIVTNLDGASLRQALLGLFGQRRARARRRRAGRGTVAQTGTGSFRHPAAARRGREERPQVARHAGRSSGRRPRRTAAAGQPEPTTRPRPHRAHPAPHGPGQAHRDAEARALDEHASFDGGDERWPSSSPRGPAPPSPRT